MSDPICRVQNPYPNNVVKLVHNLPHSEMSNDAFKEYMKSCEYGYDRFFKTYYQLACQLGLYYIDAENNYHPRFFNDINEEQAKIYLINWFSKYYVPNPYTRGFEQLKNPILVEETLYEYIKNYGNSKQILEICKEVFKEDIGNPDIFINAINSYSRKIKISNNKFEIKDFKEVSMETGNVRDDKKAFFDTFSKVNGTDKLPFPHNRIIFGAPGTGKSNKLKFESEIFINQKSEKTDSFLTHLLKCKTYGDFIKLGILHSDELKKLTVTQISQKYNVKQAYWIKKGAAYNIGEILSDEELPEEIGERLKSIPHGKQEAEGMEVGYKYCNFFEGKSKEYLIDQYEIKPVVADWIIYGAEAGMSTIEKESEVLKFLERVTFHPNYSYAQFVGTYKPVQDSADENQIKYEYIPGPFMRIYVAAKQNPSQNFLLLIEEINRANVAAVFGDVFQLLDRDENGNSEYPVAASEDIKKYLAKNGIYEDELKIPSNMYIWATMNSADQGVLPMDAAFKRRWDFEYIDINENENWNYEIPVPVDGKIKWNVLRKAINNKLKKIAGVNEDKLLGPYFISKSKLDSLKDATPEKEAAFIETFKSKVLMYLYEDVCKMRPTALFDVTLEDGQTKPHYSDICKAFDENGIGLFGFKKEDIEAKFKEPSSGAVSEQE